jgi:hypothetical protein
MVPEPPASAPPISSSGTRQPTWRSRHPHDVAEIWRNLGGEIWDTHRNGATRNLETKWEWNAEMKWEMKWGHPSK